MDVLLVEDEPLLRETVTDGLREAGLDVAVAGSAEEALAIAERNPDGAPPVLVADLHLGGGMDGLALGREVSRRWPDTGIVYATGNPDELEGRMLGPRERYVVKPYSASMLLHAVRRVMA